MAENSGISWTDHTFNPWMGCTKVSPACKFCYAERDMDHRYGRVKWGPSGNRVITSAGNWRKPRRWDRDAKSLGVRYRVFCASLADVFEDWPGVMVSSSGYSVSVQTRVIKDGELQSTVERDCTMQDERERLFRLIDETPNLDWLLLTKRPENILRMWIGGPRSNVWLGTSVENQEYADKRVPELLKCRQLAPVLFLSCEPLLGPVDLGKSLGSWNFSIPAIKRAMESSPTIDWVIAGGESGAGARPSHPDWFRSLRDQCGAAGVPFHFKQWGEYVPGDHECVTFAGEPKEILPWHSLEFDHDTTPMVRVGAKRAGRLLDEVLHDAFPITS